MPPASSSSFIPKRNPGAPTRAPRQKNFFILSIVSYSLFIAAPLASAGVFIYQLQVQKKFAEVVKNLDMAITSFNQSDYDRVITFTKRLAATNELVVGHVSVTSLLNTLGSATANTVQFKTLELTRADATKIALKATLLTPALDGALFQRGEYHANTIIDTAAFSDVKLVPSTAEAGPGGVELKADFIFNTADVLYVPINFAAAVSAPESNTTRSTSASTSKVNEITL